jgi:hypothetical protein
MNFFPRGWEAFKDAFTNMMHFFVVTLFNAIGEFYEDVLRLPLWAAFVLSFITWVFVLGLIVLAWTVLIIEISIRLF